MCKFTSHFQLYVCSLFLNTNMFNVEPLALRQSINFLCINVFALHLYFIFSFWHYYCIFYQNHLTCVVFFHSVNNAFVDYSQAQKYFYFYVYGVDVINVGMSKYKQNLISRLSTSYFKFLNFCFDVFSMIFMKICIENFFL